MPLPDIFNPTNAFSPTLGFNPNWDYGVPRKKGQNYVTQRPRWGSWNTRSTGSAGYAFDLIWTRRSLAEVQYINTFYEQYQDSFFSLIHYDNDGREHVGRFSSYSDDTQTANVNFTVRAVFEDIPYCPMNNYPSNWAAESHYLNVVDGWLNPKPMCYAASGVWVAQLTPAAVTAGLPATSPANLELFEANAAAGDYALIEYVGWGFQISLRGQDPTLGICNLWLDGVEIASGIDLCNSTVLSLNGPTASLVIPTVPYGTYARPTALVLSMPNVMLGRHQLQLVSTGAYGSSATNSGMIFPRVQVMH